ncbi:unnamed protein product, partial [Tetraodon nigroviridis]
LYLQLLQHSASSGNALNNLHPVSGTHRHVPQSNMLLNGETRRFYSHSVCVCVCVCVRSKSNAEPGCLSSSSNCHTGHSYRRHDNIE